MDFETKDSGRRIEFSTGMRRDVNEGKVRYDLIVPKRFKDHMLKRWAMLMQRGAVKYGDRNWELASTEEELERFRESAFRHFMQWFDGEADEDHAAAVLYNIQGAEYVTSRLEEKDGIQEQQERKIQSLAERNDAAIGLNYQSVRGFRAPGTDDCKDV